MELWLFTLRVAGLRTHAPVFLLVFQERVVLELLHALVKFFRQRWHLVRVRRGQEGLLLDLLRKLRLRSQVLLLGCRLERQVQRLRPRLLLPLLGSLRLGGAGRHRHLVGDVPLLPLPQDPLSHGLGPGREADAVRVVGERRQRRDVGLEVDPLLGLDAVANVPVLCMTAN